MCVPPAIIACVNVNTLRPGRAPPVRPSSFTVASINASNPSRSTIVAVNNKPAFATRFGSSKDTLMPPMACDTRVTESVSWVVERTGVENQHRPSPGGLSRGYAHHLTPNQSVDRGLILSSMGRRWRRTRRTGSSLALRCKLRLMWERSQLMRGRNAQEREHDERSPARSDASTSAHPRVRLSWRKRRRDRHPTTGPQDLSGDCHSTISPRPCR